jgi:hypothetical protein
MDSRRGRSAAFLISLVLLQPLVEAQLSAPVAHDSNLEAEKARNKFLQRKAEHDDRGIEEEM